MRFLAKCWTDRTARLCAAALCAFAAAACQTTLQSAPQASAPLPSSAIFAFDGFVGVPQGAGDEVISALVSAGRERHFALVAAGDPSAAYVMRGYLAPQAEGGTTAISYVWDVFDRAGNKVQRLAGETRLPGAVPDGWTLVQGSGARAIAEASALDISRFLSGGGAAIANAAGTAAGTPVTPVSLPAAPSQTEPAVSPAQPADAGQAGVEKQAARQVKRKSVAVSDIVGLDQAAASRIKQAAEKALGDVGYAVAQPGTPSDVRLTGEATVNPTFHGARLAAMVWKVADAQGKELGEVRQFANLRSGSIEGQAAVVKAIDGLLPGIVALAPPR